MENNVKIDKVNRSGYKSLRFDKALFDRTITILEKARAEGKPVFSALLTVFPDLQNSTNSTLFYHDSTSKTTISILLVRIVEKYGVETKGENGTKEGTWDFPGEKSPQKNSTYSTNSTIEAQDIGSDGRVVVEKPSEVVEEFLHDGGQGSLQRFLAEFPEAA